MTTKSTLISGIQPSGRLHLGNYFGALKNFVDLQNSGKYKCLFFIADYHALTEPNTKKENEERTLSLMADYLAAGLDPKKSILFVQSQVYEHTNLMWLLTTLTPLGDLERMTQFKDKAAKQKSVNAGLLFYPELMAADILIYDAEKVPVGEDQKQHLELTREIARKFNKKYGEIFTEPQPLFTKTPRVMSLSDPTKKMSKSLPKGCIFLDDEPNDIKQKIRLAVTDSGKEIIYNPKEKPAISNLLSIYSAVSGNTIEELEKMFAKSGYSDFKAALADAIIDYFEPFRKKKSALMEKPNSIKKIFAEGSKKASAIASKKFAAVKKLVGLL